MKLYRQGDVLFKEVKTIPRGEQKKRPTGHIHRVAELEAAEVLEVGDGLFLSVTSEGGVSIVHEEHDTLALPAGNYEVVRQREYSPEEIRNVAD